MQSISQKNTRKNNTEDERDETLDRQLIDLALSMPRVPENSVLLLDMALRKLGIEPDDPIEKGPPRETVLEHLLVAARDCLTKKHAL